MITPHAALEMRRRGLPEALVRTILAHPEQRLEPRPVRVILQSRIRVEESGRVQLVRVFVDVDREPAEVLTAYRTSKVGKYWEGEP